MVQLFYSGWFKTWYFEDDLFHGRTTFTGNETIMVDMTRPSFEYISAYSFFNQIHNLAPFYGLFLPSLVCPTKK